MSNYFAAEVERIFTSSLLAYGMRRTDSSAFRVRFENEDVFVDIRYDEGRSFEMDVEIGQKRASFAGGEPPYTIGEVLRLRSPEATAGREIVVAEDSTALTSGLQKLKRFLIDYGGDLLANDAATFDALLALRDRETTAYAAEGRLRARRARARVAWDEKDYARFIRILGSEVDRLTAEELIQLDEARKQVGGLS